MRVLVFHQHFTTRDGATITRIYDFARRLVDRGHEVTVVTARAALSTTGLEGPFRRGRREGMVEGIRVIELEGGYSNYQTIWQRTSEFLRFLMRSIGYVFTESYDLVLCKSVPLTNAVPGVLASLLRRKIFVFDVGDLWPAIPKAMGVKNPMLLAAMGALEWLGYRTATLNVAVAPGIVEGMRQRGVPEERIILIPNGADLDLFRPLDGPPPEIPGIAPHQFVAAYAGKHGLSNGLDWVLRAAEVLKARERQDVCILLIGDGALKPALVAEATAKGLANVLFHEPVAKRSLARLLQRADAGLQVFTNVDLIYKTTSPNKFYDYVALGLPVIVNYPGWVAETLERARCGLAVPPADPERFADALLWLADHRDEAKAMGIRARALAERGLDRLKLVDRAVDRFEDLVGTAPRAAPRPAA